MIKLLEERLQGLTHSMNPKIKRNNLPRVVDFIDAAFGRVVDFRTFDPVFHKVIEFLLPRGQIKRLVDGRAFIWMIRERFFTRHTPQKQMNMWDGRFPSVAELNSVLVCHSQTHFAHLEHLDIATKLSSYLVQVGTNPKNVGDRVSEQRVILRKIEQSTWIVNSLRTANQPVSAVRGIDDDIHAIAHVLHVLHGVNGRTIYEVGVRVIRYHEVVWWVGTIKGYWRFWRFCHFECPESVSCMYICVSEHEGSF